MVRVMPTFKIILAYDGTGFVGWQRQDNGVSIQALIEDALRALDGRDVTVAGAGRTDAGVHALGQVASFTLARELEPDAVARALNGCLPRAIRVMAAESAPPAFHPRFTARSKTYRYRLWNARGDEPVRARIRLARARTARRRGDGRRRAAARRTARLRGVPGHRQLGRDHRARDLRIACFVSRTAASALAPRSAPRIPRCCPTRSPATGFLRHMVRIIVGSLVEIGRGRQPVGWISAVIAARDRTLAGPTAPPHGLFLVGDRVS